VVHTKQIAFVDEIEVDPERVDPEGVRLDGVADGDVASCAFVETLQYVSGSRLYLGC